MIYLMFKNCWVIKAIACLRSPFLPEINTHYWFLWFFVQSSPDDYTAQQVFQWSDNETFNPEEDYKNWGIDSPETG